MKTNLKFESEADAYKFRQYVCARLTAIESAMCTLMAAGESTITTNIGGCKVACETKHTRSNRGGGAAYQTMQTLWSVDGKRVASRAVEQTIINNYITR